MFDQEDFKEFIEFLNSHKVRYLLIGGWAVGFHGFPRYTGDMDIWVNPDEETAEKMLTVLKDFGLRSMRLTMDDFLKNGMVIQFGYEPRRIDVIIEAEGFKSAFKNKIVHRFGRLPINIVGYKELLMLKQNAGRDQE